MRWLRSLSAVVIAATVLATASACQVALRADGEDPRCDDPGSVCAPGLTCQGGFCRPCAPEPEVCDGKDNDCNGLTDEGFDQDGDGFKTCGEAGEIDCNDDPARNGKAIHPGVKELCNGYDDNCNGITDESPNDCDPDRECWSAKGICTIKNDCRIHGCDTGGCNPTTGECTNPDCRVSKNCMPGETCDPTSGTCVKVTGIGEPCDPQTRCSAGSSCIDLSELGIGARSSSICSKACCDSSGCPDGFVCRGGATAAAVCVKAADLGLTAGTLAANSKCTSPSDCRSGVCDSGYCSDSCCSTITCGNGGTCSFKSDNKFMCRNPSGSANPGEGCDGDSDCKSGYCWPMLFGGKCSKHCCTSDDCDNGWRCGAFNESGQIVTACTPFGYGASHGSKRGGEPCGGAGDCRSGACGDGVCTDFCCRDTDCAAGTVCKPRKLSGGSYALVCTKPT